ncbi:hypothetical protein [Plantactinospora sp. CA-290183]|uniref:hypothetical protein n=1 Tax=Plantactinospora sp. CA-290183 TaxID=3240006 RepID=UPI003D90F1B0
MNIWDVLGSPAWGAVESLGTAATVGVAAWAAYQARISSSRLASIESQRRHSELCPRFNVTCERFNPGSDRLRMRVMLLGPSGLDRLDRLTIVVRNDHFRRGEGYLNPAGPSAEEIRQHIWGPYRFVPGTGPDDAQADTTGRETVYEDQLPVGEELPYEMEPTGPGHWMTGTTPEQWRNERGNVIRLGFAAEHAEHGMWYLPCEIDVANMPATVKVGWA